MGRDEKGRFVKGYGGGPGRPKKERELKYYQIMETSVSTKDWTEICQRAVMDAKRGDAAARKWLSDYLIGVPVQRMEHSGAEGGPIRYIEVVIDSTGGE
jgi:hypothetical protein